MTTPQTFRLPFTEWLPDQAEIDINGMQQLENAVPFLSGYGPFRGLTVYSGALDGRCQGAASLQDNSGNALNFGGDATKLYKLASAAWGDVTRVSGGAYATGTSAAWYFAKFKELVIAVNGTDAPQKFDMASSSNFEALAGSPPTAKYVATVRDQVVLGGLSTDPSAVFWSAFNNAEGWTAATDQAGTQSFPEGGWVRNVVGGETMYIFQEHAIQRGTYIGGALVYQFDEVERNRGLFTSGAIARVGSMIFFLDDDGFYVISADGGQSKSIGSEKVDKTFFANLNESYVDRIRCVVDPINKLVIWAYPSSQSVDGVLDKLIFYNWEIGRWGEVTADVEMIYAARQEGTDLDSLDALYPSGLDSIPFSLDSRVFSGGSLQLAAFNTAHQLAFFTGDTLKSVLCAKERQLFPGKRARITNATPIADTSSATVAVGNRERRADNIAYTAESSMQSNGSCPSLSSGRYTCARMTIPAGTEWAEAQGVDVEAAPMGMR